MTTLIMGIGDYRRSPSHQEIIDCVRHTPRGQMRCVDLACGRGYGKSTIAVYIAGLALFHWMPALPGLVTEPTGNHLHKVWIREFRKVWPGDLWELKSQPLQIVSKVGPGVLDLASRNVDNPNKEISKGPNYAWAIEDEAAYKFRRTDWVDVHAAIRHPYAPFRFHMTTTTPKLNEYAELVKERGHHLFQRSTYDNPFLPSGFAEELERSCDPHYAEQEIHGKFVALRGRIWEHFVDEVAPQGNRWSGGHEDGQPWELWCDLGIRSAWLAVQKHYDSGRARYVITHEWQPNNEGAEQTLQRINATLGCPMRVIVGSDIDTRSVANAARPITFFRRQWGDGVQVTPVRGRVAGKDLQHMVTSAAILDNGGCRRLFVASRLVSHDKRNARGILDVMTKDQWPDVPRVGEFLPKTKNRPGMADTEDTRDALMYGLVVNEPPELAMQQYHAMPQDYAAA